MSMIFGMYKVDKQNYHSGKIRHYLSFYNFVQTADKIVYTL